MPRSLDALDGDARDLIHVDELLFFFLDQVFEGFADFILRFFVRWPKMLGSMSLMLMSISSTPWLEMISNAGKLRSRTSISTMRSSSLPSRSCSRSFSRVRGCESRRNVCV